MINITDVSDIMILSETLYLKNKSQARILLELAKARNEDRSLTSYSLNKDHGIPLSTWQDNYSYLEKNQLIKPDKKNRIILRKKQGSKKKTSRPKFPYIITDLGIVCLLKSIIEESNDMVLKDPLLWGDGKYVDFRNEDLDMLLSFLPIFSNHRKELQKMFENNMFRGILFHIMTSALDKVGFDFISDSEKIPYEIIDYYEIFLENDKSNSIKIYRWFDLDKTNYDEQKITVFHRITFLFFYNLFRLIKGDTHLLEITTYDSKLPLPDSKETDKLNTEQEREEFFSKIIQKHREITHNFVSKNESRLYRLVEKDSDLKYTMEYHYREINEALNKRRTFEEIQSNFHMK